MHLCLRTKEKSWKVQASSEKRLVRKHLVHLLEANVLRKLSAMDLQVNKPLTYVKNGVSMNYPLSFYHYGTSFLSSLRARCHTCWKLHAVRYNIDHNLTFYYQLQVHSFIRPFTLLFPRSCSVGASGTRLHWFRNHFRHAAVQWLSWFPRGAQG